MIKKKLAILDSSEQSEQDEQSFIDERESFFNCLTKEQQLLVFCEVVSRLTKAEIDEGKTYRGVLYETFQFKEDAYKKAQMSDFLRMHNCLEREQVNLEEYAIKVLKFYGIEETVSGFRGKINKAFPIGEFED